MWVWILQTFLWMPPEPMSRVGIYLLPGEAADTLRVFARIPRDELVVRNRHALFELRVRVKDGKGKPLREAFYQQSFVVSDTLALLTRSYNLVLARRDRYRVEVEGWDALTSRALWGYRFELAGTPENASVWLSTPIPADTLQILRFPVYTSRDPRFLIYWEGRSDSLPAVFRVLQGNVVVLEDHVTFRQSPTALRFPLKNFPNGLFVLEVRSGNPAQVRTTPFYVFRFDHMSDRELRMTVELLRYVMDDHAVRAFQEAPPDRRAAVWDSLWATLDPDPTTPMNEIRDRFEAKILYVNHAFRYANIPGVLTDRGRTYLKFGPPDEIDRHPFDFDSVPYEIWYYEQPVRRVFYFVDRKGIGDYVLVDPQRFDLFRP